MVIPASFAACLSGMASISPVTSAITALVEDVELADGLVDLPGAAPAAGEHRAVAGADLQRLAPLRGDRHPARQDVDRLVGLQRPVRRTRGALPNADLLVAVGPQRRARGLHRLAGGLGQRAPVLQVTGECGGSQERGAGNG